MTAVIVPLPLFFLIQTPAEPHPHFEEVEGHQYLPLFTSRELIDDYIRRSGASFVVGTIPDLAAICGLLLRFRPHTPTGEFAIAMDWPGPGDDVAIYDVPYFISLLATGRAAE